MMGILKVILLLAVLSGILMAVGAVFAGRKGVLVAFVVSLLLNLGGYWYSDSIVLKMYQARKVTEVDAPELYRAVKGLSQRAGLPMPGVYIIPSASPNAFATGRNESHAAVAVTEGILKILNRDELEGVLAHELAHIRNRDILIATAAATIAGSVVMLAHMARWAVVFAGGKKIGRTVGTLALSVVAPVAATMVQMALSRSREFEADAGGAAISGKPEALAGALEKLSAPASREALEANPSTAHMFIVNPLTAEGAMRWFRSHPPVDQRVARLKALKPAY
jgi:heat shock protein HtpX